MKPRLTRKPTNILGKYVWLCRSATRVGFGSTAKNAYLNWMEILHPTLNMKSTYMPLPTMLEPKGSRIFSLLSWIYFRNSNYMNGGSVFTRICGWQSIRVAAEIDKSQLVGNQSS